MTTTLVTEVILRTTEGEGVTWDTIDPLPQEEGTTNPPDQDTWPHLHLNISKTFINTLQLSALPNSIFSSYVPIQNYPQQYAPARPRAPPPPVSYYPS